MSLRTLRRWIHKAVQRAPVLVPAIIRLCYEVRPDLPLSAQDAVGPAGTRGETARLLHWASMWKKVTSGFEPQKSMSGFAALNIVGPVEGLWC